MRAVFGAALLALLAGCAAAPPVPQAAAPERPPWPEPVGQVALERAPEAAERTRLDVGVVLFDPGIPEDPTRYDELGIFPEIRRVEARYMAVLLREFLVDSAAWGAVRVLPEPDDRVPLQVQGEILHSDGLHLALRIRASDATGRVWLERDYLDRTGAGDYPVAADGEPFADLYRQVANDLLAAQRRLEPTALREITEVARLRYAASLAPDAFGGYLERDGSGSYRLVRLPSRDDPMLSRVDRIREREYLFIDVVDEQFVDLRGAMAPTYGLWREFGREQLLYREAYRQRVAERGSQGSPGSFYAMQRSYDAYKWTRIHEQDLEELAGGFNNEVRPTVLEAEGSVYRLTGSREQQYREWRDILRRIFALETGLTGAAAP